VSRAYDEFLARVFDHVGPAGVALLLLAVAVAVGLLWFTYPAWLRIRVRFPRWNVRFPKWNLRFPAWKWRWPSWKRKRPRRTKKVAQPAIRLPVPQADPVPRDEVVMLSVADRLAAEGRYAEAIRERLRESVTALSRYGVISPAPAWTAHEVATRAGERRPAISDPLTGATSVFSEVWYARHPAGPDQDALMRRLTAEIKAALESPR
jgi:hypothetical protein